MRRSHGLIIAAALLFVGAGCSGATKSMPPAGESTQGAVGSPGEMGDAGAEARRAETTDSVDFDIQMILTDAETEKAEALGAGVEATAVGAEDAGLDSLIDGDYDVK